jgi:hypothetical protein
MKYYMRVTVADLAGGAKPLLAPPGYGPVARWLLPSPSTLYMHFLPVATLMYALFILYHVTLTIMLR